MKTKETIKATPNYSKRTFTLRKYYNGLIGVKYRTMQLDEDEFESYLNYTNKDWLHFLNKRYSLYHRIRYYLN